MVGFPLLLIPLAIYNIIVFLMPDVSITAPLVKLVLMSGAEWTVTLSDVLLTLGILLLLAEVIKGARPGAKYLTDHLLSLIVFGAAATEFVMLPKFGNSIYFLLVLLAMADFFGGVAQRTRRRAYATDPAPPPRTARRQVEEPVEPTVAARVEPAPAPQPAPVVPPAPSAQSVAESVLMDHPAPKPVTPSPEISSPHLQPSNGTPSPGTPSR